MRKALFLAALIGPALLPPAAPNLRAQDASPRPVAAGELSAPERPEEESPEIPPELAGSALTLDIAFRVTPAKAPEEVWEQRTSRDALPGGSIQVRMVSKSLVILVQFNPLLRSDGSYTLRAGGQVWLSQGEGALRYHAAVTSLDMKKGETVIFYPLGEGSGADLIEVLITLNPYKPAER